MKVTTRRVRRLGRAVDEPAGHPPGEDGRLARTGPGQDAERGGLRRDGLALGPGEAPQEKRRSDRAATGRTYRGVWRPGWMGAGRD